MARAMATRVGPSGSLSALHGDGDRYGRRRPEETVLYRVVRSYWDSFRERVEAIGSLPRFVVREVEEYLRCGILEYGFMRVECEGCGFERLVAFSCKRRGFCPSCLGRRMSDGAVHLTEEVLPEVQLRQWVCSLPWELHVVVGYDRELCAAVVGAFVEELLRSYRWRAKRMFGLSSVEDTFPGAVTVIQRFDSALRLNVHAHTLVLDGVYVRQAGMDGECLSFLRLPACYDVAARAPALRVVEPSRIREDERVAVVMGFNVHAGAAIDGRDRKRVERVCRYLVRPPIATERLGFVGEKVRYELKKVWRDGTRRVVLDPYDFLARVCAMVPPPRFHMVRFHGVLAPNAALRREVVSSARSSAAPKVAPPRAPLQLPLFGELFDVDDATGGKARRKPWAWLLRHVFAIDVTTCPKCASTMRAAGRRFLLEDEIGWLFALSAPRALPVAPASRDTAFPRSSARQGSKHPAGGRSSACPASPLR
jgi:hypothetical protein